MQCPKCQTEVLDWQFYCPNCRASIHDYAPVSSKPRRGKIERVGARVLTVVVGIFIIGVLALMARTVRWNELYNAIRGNEGISADASSDSRKDRASRAGASPARRGDGSSTPAKPVEVAKRENSAAVESVRDTSQKIEELPSPEDQPQVPKPRTPAAPAKAEPPPPGTTGSDSASRPAVQPANSDAQLGVEQIDAKTSGEAGFVAINSYTPARIYIDGQYSGTTPRTIKLGAGDHQIRLMADGHEDWTRRIRLKTRQQIGIMASMRKKEARKD